jgi:hypothetical protein
VGHDRHRQFVLVRPADAQIGLPGEARRTDWILLPEHRREPSTGAPPHVSRLIRRE